MEVSQATDAGPIDAATRRNLKRQRREALAERRLKLEAAERRRRLLLWGAGIAVAVLALAGLIYWLVRPESIGSRASGTVQTFPNQGQTHIARGQTHAAYNSLPPTSGWHWADAVAPWGISNQPIVNEVQVHNLEHGGIMVQYDCPDGCPDVVSKLESVVRTYPSKVVLAPYPGLAASGHRIALTAWTKLAYLDNVDEAFIRQFVSDYKNKGPELVPD